MIKLKSVIGWNALQLTLDWIGCFGLFYIVYLIESSTRPFKSRQFILSDVSIGHPFTTNEIVPVKGLFWLALGLPMLILLISYLKVKNWKFVHIAVIGLFFNLTLDMFIVQLLKNLVGRLRPDFIDRCKPATEFLTSTAKLFNSEICTQTDNWMMRDGAQSFPSGHAASTFGSLLFLALYFNQIFKLKEKEFKWIQYYCFIIPLSIATFVGISRIRDYRHHWEDVLVGSIIGILTGLFSFFHYFKRLTTSQLAEAYELIDTTEN